MQTGRALLPRAMHVFLTRTCLKAVSGTLMRLLTSAEGVPAFNGYALEQLAADLAQVERWAAGVDVPHLVPEVSEPKTLCRLLMSETVRKDWEGVQASLQADPEWKKN